MSSKQTEKLQIMVSPETLNKLNKLIAADALAKGTRMKTLSGWVRELIEDTIEFEINKKMIEEFDIKRDIKKIKSK